MKIKLNQNTKGRKTILIVLALFLSFFITGCQKNVEANFRGAWEFESYMMLLTSKEGGDQRNYISIADTASHEGIEGEWEYDREGGFIYISYMEGERADIASRYVYYDEKNNTFDYSNGTFVYSEKYSKQWLSGIEGD